MSSPKKIGRWNRFEIAFTEDGAANASLCRESWATTPEKMRELRKIENKNAGANAPSSDETPRNDAGTSKKSAEKSASESGASASLWAEARRRAQRVRERGESAALGEKSDGSPSSEGETPFLPRRPRTFRASEPPRRFDEPRDR